MVAAASTFGYKSGDCAVARGLKRLADNEEKTRRTLRRPAGVHHRRDEALLSRLRHERDRVAGAARRAGRPEAGAPAHPLHHERERLHAGQPAQEVGPRHRRHHGQIPSARQSGDLRCTGSPGPDLLDAAAAARRAGQLRLDRRGSAGGGALHRGSARPPGLRRCSTTSTRTRSISCRTIRASSRSRPFCRPASPTSWSMGPAASRSAWRPTSRPTTSAR